MKKYFALLLAGVMARPCGMRRLFFRSCSSR